MLMVFLLPRPLPQSDTRGVKIQPPQTPNPQLPPLPHPPTHCPFPLTPPFFLPWNVVKDTQSNRQFIYIRRPASIYMFLSVWPSAGAGRPLCAAAMPGPPSPLRPHLSTLFNYLHTAPARARVLTAALLQVRLPIEPSALHCGDANPEAGISRQ